MNEMDSMQHRNSNTTKRKTQMIDVPWITKKAKKRIVPEEEKPPIDYGDRETLDLLCMMKGITQGTVLEDVQISGIRWMIEMEANGLGGILAHDMGLGKSLQSLVLIMLTYDADPRPTLILTAKKCVDTWINEAMKFFGKGIRILHYRGPGARWISYGLKSEASSRPLTRNMINQYDVVITHYECVAYFWDAKVRTPVFNYLATLTGNKLKNYGSDLEAIQKTLLSSKFQHLDWSCFERARSDAATLQFKLKPDGLSEPMVDIIVSYPYKRIMLDEGHKIKTKKNLVTQFCHSLVATYKWVMTGTPEVNSPLDLWAQLEFIGAPDLKAYNDFKECVNSIKRVQAAEAARQASSIVITWGGWQELIDQANLGYINSMVRKYIYILSKKNLAMDGKSDDTLVAEMTRYPDETLEIHSYKNIPPLYQRYVTVIPSQNFSSIYKTMKTGLKAAYYKTSGKERTKFLLASMPLMVHMCSSPTSMDRQKLCEYADAELIDKVMNEDPPKFPHILDYIKTNVKENEKCIANILIVETGRELVTYLKIHNIESLMIHGGTPDAERAMILKDFANNAKYKCLVVTKCMSLGVNLTMANHYLFGTAWWNKAEINQSRDRIHRIGQKLDVHCIFFIIPETVDVEMMRISEGKENVNEKTRVRNERIMGFSD